MLIDGGERGSEDEVTKYLRGQGVERLEYVVATHPHSDHVGGLAYGILESFPVGTVIAPRLSAENMPGTRSYEVFLEAVGRLARGGTKAVYARPGQEFPLGEATVRVLGPLREDAENHNNNSVVLQIRYKESAALFTGDAEKSAEAALADRWGGALRSDLLKAGHHGSKTSSNEGFLALANPSAVVVSCGVGNGYGHPSPEVLQRCRARGVAVFRTDIDRTVVFVSDGTGFEALR
jgi:beta-lactamase superfamily II metal-dependent hydrolase